MDLPAHPSYLWPLLVFPGCIVLTSILSDAAGQLSMTPISLSLPYTSCDIERRNTRSRIEKLDADTLNYLCHPTYPIQYLPSIVFFNSSVPYSIASQCHWVPRQFSPFMKVWLSWRCFFSFCKMGHVKMQSADTHTNTRSDIERNTVIALFNIVLNVLFHNNNK